MLWRMGWRNVWRNKRRTLITVASVAFGLWLAVTFVGMGHYSYESMIDSSAKMGFGHVAVQPKDYRSSPSLDKRVVGAQALARRIRQVDGVAGAVVRISGQAMFATASRSIGGLLLGIDPSAETEDINLFLGAMVEGELFDGNDRRGIVIGKTMAERLDLRLGKKIVYTSIDASGEIISEVAKVRGMFSTGVDAVDGSVVLLPIDAVRRALGYGPGDATLVSVYAKDQRDADVLVDRIEMAIGASAASGGVGGGDREVLTWRQTQPEVASMIGLDRSMNYLFQVFAGLLIAAGVLNTMLMSVLERKHEFGVLLAVGMEPVKLFLLVLVESFYIALIGIGMGMCVVVPWYAFLLKVGIDISAYMGDDVDVAGVLMDPVLRISVRGDAWTIILLAIFGFTLLAGLYPAIKAGRQRVVESLKTL